MKTFQAELAGIITRDIIWREVDALDEGHARAIFAEMLPGYRLRAIMWRQDGSTAPESQEATPVPGTSE